MKALILAAGFVSCGAKEGETSSAPSQADAVAAKGTQDAAVFNWESLQANRVYNQANESTDENIPWEGHGRCMRRHCWDGNCQPGDGCIYFDQHPGCPRNSGIS